MQRMRIAGGGEHAHSGLVTALEDLADVRLRDAVGRPAGATAG